MNGFFNTDRTMWCESENPQLYCGFSTIDYEKPQCTTRMQNLRERRSQTSSMHDSVEVRVSANIRLVEKPSKESIQLSQKENKQLETWKTFHPKCTAAVHFKGRLWCQAQHRQVDQSCPNVYRTVGGKPKSRNANDASRRDRENELGKPLSYRQTIEYGWTSRASP